MSFQEIMDAQGARVERLKNEVANGERRLAAIDPLRRRLTAVSQCLPSLFADALQSYPAAVQRMQQRLPTIQALLPMEKSLRQAWEQRYREMQEVEIPALTTATRTAETVAAQYTARLPGLTSRLDEARRLELVSVLPVPRMSFWKSVKHFIRTWQWPAQSVQSVKVVILSQMLTMRLTSLRPMQNQLVQTRIDLENGWADVNNTLDKIRAMLEP